MYEVALNILKKLEDNNFHAYIVGGYPRDKYMNIISNDIDICTSAKPTDIVKLFDNVDTKYSNYGNVIINESNYSFQVTTFRKDIKYLSNRNDLIIEFVSNLEEDLIRRDFIMNTLCINYKGEYIDLMGAKNDIDNKIIRLIGNSEKLIEDPLRILRAIRFSIALNFQLDDSLRSEIIKHGYLVEKLSNVKKRDEITKIYGINKDKSLSLLKELKIDKYLIDVL